MTKKVLPFILGIFCILYFTECKSTNKQKNNTQVKIKVDSTQKENNMNQPDSNNTSDTSTATDTSNEINLSIHVSLLKAIPSTLNISIYGIHNDFPSTNDQLKTFTFKVNSSTYTAVLKGIKYGTYAIAMYQDENNSGQINKNMLGIPTERYGFSQNYIPKVKAPNFDNCKFEFNEKSTSINIAMIP